MAVNNINLPLVAIVGRPNVGKSSLFNRLIGTRQAITHETAGTTRDANTGTVSWRKHNFWLIDTAGLSKATDDIELGAQEQITEAADNADVIIVVVDAGIAPTTEDQTAARLALKTGKPVILAVGKADTTHGQPFGHWQSLGISEIVPVSAIHGSGTGDLLDAVCDRLDEKPAPVEDENVITLALIGRPNVGKSSLLNRLVGKQQALVSDVPGTTRDSTVSEIRYHNQTIKLIDTAGLRRRGKIAGGIEKYSAMRTLAAINQADVCALVMDATTGPVAGDQHLAGQIIESGKGLILVVNKWDAVEDKETNTQDDMAATVTGSFQFAWWAPLIFTSATHGLHLNELMEQAAKIQARRHTTIETGPLNKLIGQLVAKQPPAGLRNRQPKLNYGTQTGSNPPAFAIFGAHTAFIHFSYKRYIENAFRKTWDFTGTPIVLNFRDKPGRHSHDGTPVK
ncbi:ribosome biogenesis GTPase Der [bacterium]|nr:MAG: ribosome biogenesis GTPase Der [bacterium]